MILASVRNGRMADRVGKFVIKSVDKQGMKSFAVTILDPLKVDTENKLNRQPMHFLPKSEKAPVWMHKTTEIFSKADGFLVLSPEYNGFMPPALLNTMNSVQPASFRHRPVGIITYTMGNTGAMRALNVLRPYVCELGMLCVPGLVPIPVVHEAIDEEGNCKNDLINENLRKLLGNLEWYANAIRNHLKNGNKYID